MLYVDSILIIWYKPKKNFLSSEGTASVRFSGAPTDRFRRGSEILGAPKPKATENGLSGTWDVELGATRSY